MTSKNKVKALAPLTFNSQDKVFPQEQSSLEEIQREQTQKGLDLAHQIADQQMKLLNPILYKEQELYL